MPSVFRFRAILPVMLGELLLSAVMFANEPPFTAAAINIDGDLVAVGSQAGVYVFSARTVIDDSEFNTAELRDRHQSFRLNWEAHSTRIRSQLSYVHDLAFDPVGKVLAVAGGTPGQFGQVELYDTGNWERLSVLSDHDDVVMSVAWTDNRLYSAGYDGKVCVSEPVDLANPRTWAMTAQSQLSNRPLTAIRILERADRRLCIVAGLDQTIQIYAAELTSDSRPVRTLNNHVAPVLDLAIIPGARQDEPFVMASVSEDKTVRFWHPESGRLLRFVRLDEIPLHVGLIRTGDRLLCLAGTAGTGPAVIDAGTATRLVWRPERPDRCTVCLPVPQLNAVIFGSAFPELNALSLQFAR